MARFEVKTEEGNYDLQADVQIIGQDLLVAIWGGEKPHIGAITVAQPRPSLQDPDLVSSSASVICLPGHKEDELSRKAALKISKTMNANTVVTAGIHWDYLSTEGIQQVVKNSDHLVDLILQELDSQYKGDAS